MPEAIKRDTARLERLRPRDPEALLPTASDYFPASRARASIVHICITTHGEFHLSKPLSKGWREPFFEALAKTRNVEKAALFVGIRRNTA